MNFNNYTRVQLGLPPASQEAGVASIRRARMMRMNGFGATISDPNVPLSGFYGREGDRWDVWMNEAARTWARVRGNEAEAITFRNRGVSLNGAFGRGWFESCSTFATPLPDNTTDCNEIPVVGLACRGLPINFHPCESITKMSAVQVAQKAGKGLEAFFKEGGNQSGSEAIPSDGDTGGDTVGGSDTIEEKKDNTMLFVGLGVAAVAVLALSMRK
jgi:hypothetical protein